MYLFICRLCQITHMLLVGEGKSKKKNNDKTHILNFHLPTQKYQCKIHPVNN